MTYSDIWRPLAAIYGEGEAKAIVRYMLDISFGLSAADIYSGAVERLDARDMQRLSAMLGRLHNCEPVQYVVGYADFCGRLFAVDSRVLIPRPETEELCQWIVGDAKVGADILDVGTGSGCIAATLALNVIGSRVVGWDISEGALSVARFNASKLGAAVNFHRADALYPPLDHGQWDIVVSNPPYICESERVSMESNVVDYEPPKALFVSDDDPLLFYRAIAQYAKTALRKGGILYFELNPLYADDVVSMLAGYGFSCIETRNDMSCKRRMAKALRL